MLKKHFILPLAFFSLVGCSLWPEHDPLPEYTLKAPLNVDVEEDDSDVTLVIDLPQADASLNTQRIAVDKGDYRLDYYAHSQWADKLPHLLQDILIHTFEDAGTFKGIGRPSTGIVSDYMLQSELRDFAAHYDGTGEAPTIVINAHVRLMEMKDRKIDASRTFSLSRQAPENTLDSVIVTFNEQAQELVLKILKWALKESQ